MGATAPIASPTKDSLPARTERESISVEEGRFHDFHKGKEPEDSFRIAQKAMGGCSTSNSNITFLDSVIGLCADDQCEGLFK